MNSGVKEQEGGNMEIKTCKGRSKKSFISHIFSEYCSNTSIHGIGYLGSKDKSIIEKIWWFIAFTLSLATCIILINNIWRKWVNTPVVMGFSHTQTPIWEIPFPAVTICPVNKVLQNEYNYTQAYRNRNNLSEKGSKMFWDISLICNLKFISLPDVNETTDEDVIKSIMKVSPKLSLSVTGVTWQGSVLYDEFTSQLTEEGVCFTFNSLNDMYTDQVNPNLIIANVSKVNEGWTIENGYPDHLEMETYPRRTGQDGIRAGLSVTLLSRSFQKDYICGDFTSGYKVLLHNPAETPRVKQQYILAPLNRHVTVSVKPEMVTTSSGLLQVSPQTRNCYYAHEKSLRFYKMYTQDNCQVECVANVTRHLCKCLPFYSPRDNETNICGYGSLPCVKSSKKYILQYELLSKKVKDNSRSKLLPGYRQFQRCQCLPACSSIEYTAETSQTVLHFVKSITKFGLFRDSVIGLIDVDITRVEIFFRQSQFMTLHRNEMYGLTDFMANCGGLLGLFMGFSFLSLVEIVYYMTLRIWCRLKNKDNLYDINI